MEPYKVNPDEDIEKMFRDLFQPQHDGDDYRLPEYVLIDWSAWMDAYSDYDDCSIPMRAKFFFFERRQHIDAVIKVKFHPGITHEAWSNGTPNYTLAYVGDICH